ncbi:MAG TPA: hypothetical protein VKY74_27210 [Chloroflexia bacterium]|nr:hypothetical protein [Chloroflexia bacterium]
MWDSISWDSTADLLLDMGAVIFVMLVIMFVTVVTRRRELAAGRGLPPAHAIIPPAPEPGPAPPHPHPGPEPPVPHPGPLPDPAPPIPDPPLPGGRN